MSRRPFLERTRRARERRNQMRTGADPIGAIKLAGLGAIILLFLAVAAGFRQDRFAQGAAAVLSALGFLVEPILWGASILELAALGLAGAVIAVLAIRAGRR